MVGRAVEGADDGGEGQAGNYQVKAGVPGGGGLELALRLAVVVVLSGSSLGACCCAWSPRALLGRVLEIALSAVVVSSAILRGMSETLVFQVDDTYIDFQIVTSVRCTYTHGWISWTPDEGPDKAS